MPHSVRIDDMSTCIFCNAYHFTIHIGRNTTNHVFRRLAQSFRPVFSYQVMIGTNSSGSNNNIWSWIFKCGDNVSVGCSTSFLGIIFQNISFKTLAINIEFYLNEKTKGYIFTEKLFLNKKYFNRFNIFLQTWQNRTKVFSFFIILYV